MGRLIDTVVLTPLKVVSLDAGNVMLAIRADSEGYRGFGEAYFSMLTPGAVKAWRRHRRMTLNLVVPVGAVAVAVVDAEAGVGRRYDIGPDNYSRLTVPPGLWTGFQGMADRQSVVLNVADIGHDPAESERRGPREFAFDWQWPPFPAGGEQRVS